MNDRAEQVTPGSRWREKNLGHVVTVTRVRTTDGWRHVTYTTDEKNPGPYVDSMLVFLLHHKKLAQ